MTFKSRSNSGDGARSSAKIVGRSGSQGGTPRFLGGGRGASRADMNRPGFAAQMSATSASAGVPAFLLRPAPVATATLGVPGDRFEVEADRAARRVGSAGVPDPRPESVVPTLPRVHAATSASGPSALLGRSGRPLDADTRSFMEQRFSADFGQVRIHTDGQAAQLNRDLRANAFTQGNDVFYGEGRVPGRDELTAHELAHVVQQAGGARDSAVGPLSARTGPSPIQCSFAGSYLIPGRSDGAFEIDLQTREGAPAAQSGMDGYIRFVPAPGAPNSNVIAVTQIVRLTNAGGADLDPLSMPAAQAPRGALGSPGLRTEDDAGRSVEGGFFTDVHHRPNSTSPGMPQGSALSPRYNFQPAAPGSTGTAGQTAQPGVYGGGIGGVVGQKPGFKRSDDPADIRSATMYDFPGTSSATASLDFAFESVALGEDTGLVYGGVNWGFGLRAGKVVSEHLNVAAGQSATFGEALERHRDFYVHEPVTFYFGFDSDVLSAAEAAKIDAFLPYLTRNPDVELLLEGFADQIGGASDYNLDLSLRRAESAEAALLAKGVAAPRINGIVMGSGASTSATTDAGTGDQGGNAAVGADQRREANRWANRRVILSFSHVPTTP